ncbi:MAG: MtrB/PioB family decaheme-associated outer membrane protein [Rubrivivax sp.]|nr:MtrB/PioB family decaheme-associated outer membrane protein [Rubrivivax sp.]
MRTSSPWLLLGTVGALSSAAALNAGAAEDTSRWQCKLCPFEQGVSGSVEVGAGNVSDRSARFGDTSGLQRKGAYLAVGGSIHYHGDDGLHGSLTAADLGLDTRSLSLNGGIEGRLGVRLAYDELPRHFSDGAATPFLGVGGDVLTLPPGFASATTAEMPLASTLQAVGVGYKRSRLDLGATWLASGDFSLRVGARHMVRDGTQRTSGAFFVTAAQLVAPLDQSTDELEATVIYSGRQFQASLGYQASTFRNAQSALTWSNPYTLGALTAERGQLALAPDNQFHQLQATLAYQFSPQVRASADIASGRMTQDASFLASTLNTGLAVPGLPASSLQGRVDTLNASVRLTAAVSDKLRLNATLSRDERDNQTPTATYQTVSTDMFLGPLRTNRPYSFTQDRVKLNADYRGPGSLKLVVGAEHHTLERSQQEVSLTRETTAFARASAQPVENFTLALKLAHGQRDPSAYAPLAWVDPAENPLLRKYSMAKRVRQTTGVRADFALSETFSFGLDFDYADDNYPLSTIGLSDARTIGIGADISWAISEQTQLLLFARGDQIRSRQTGSQAFGVPDWWALNRDATSVFGLSLRHAVIKDRLDIGADLTASHSRSEIELDTAAASPPFPNGRTRLDRFKLFATYRLNEVISLTGSFWHERYDSRDWSLDGVLPATIPNVLTLGEQPARYKIDVVSLVMRYRF